jgi:L-aminopeptidase/D-esterase-like protein
VVVLLARGPKLFGLAAVGGVERYLEEQGVGSKIGPVTVPSVPGAVIFDLGVADPTGVRTRATPRASPPRGSSLADSRSGLQ